MGPFYSLSCKPVSPKAASAPTSPLATTILASGSGGLCVCFAVFLHAATLLSQAYQAFKIRTLPPRRALPHPVPTPTPCPSPPHAEGPPSKPLLIPASHPANLSHCVPASPGGLESGWDSVRQTFLTPPVPDLGGRPPPPQELPSRLYLLRQRSGLRSLNAGRGSAT